MAIETEVISPETLHLRFTSGFSQVIVLAGSIEYPVTDVTKCDKGRVEVTVKTGDGPNDRYTQSFTRQQKVRVKA